MKRALIIIALLALLIPASLLAQTGSVDDPPDKLATPVLTATASDSTIELSWDAVPHATHYRIWAWSSTDSWIDLGGSHTGTSFSHADLVPDREYLYIMLARDSSGRSRSSSWSNWARAVAPTPVQTMCSLTFGIQPFQLRQETIDAYGAQFGGPSPIFLGGLVKVVWHLDGRVEIWYSEGLPGRYRVVSELWRGCEYIGHTPWQHLESMDSFR